MNNKIQGALNLSEEILNDFEDPNQKISSTVLKCLKLARMMDDTENLEWLICETQGYKYKDKVIPEKLFIIALEHGRMTGGNAQMQIFNDLASQLEKKIESAERALGTFTTKGVSVNGNDSHMAMNNLLNTTTKSTNILIKNIDIYQNKLAKLRGQYYNYALNVNMQLKFSDKVADIFSSYRITTDAFLSEFIPDSILKLSSIYARLNETDEDSWSQAAITCRKLLVEFSNSLFGKVYPDCKETSIKTKTGQDLDITGDKYANRLSAVLDAVSTNEMKRDNLLATVAWLDDVNSRISDEATNDVEYDEIRSNIVHLYLLLADVIAEYKKHLKNDETEVVKINNEKVEVES